MKTRLLFSTLSALIVATSPCFADKEAKVTEAVNEVSHGASQSAVTKPAKIGTEISDGEYLKTGVKSRAELELPNQTITRMGANTIFNYSASTNEVDLKSGTILFSKPKDGKTMQIKTAAVTAAIVGTTGFVQKTEKGGFIFGLIEGHAELTIDGVDYDLEAGQVLKFTPGGKPQIFSFDIPRLVETAPLLTKFHHPLHNQKYIDKEIAEYNDLVSRGFIQPPKDPFFLIDPEQQVPTLPIIPNDSVGQAHDQFNQPPSQPQEPPCRPRWCHPCCYGPPSGA